MPGTKPEPSSAPVPVMVAVVRTHRDETLVALRRADSHQGGLWEFPGGKREPGEPPLQALHRELREETGLRILASHPLCKVEHRYSDKHVLLDTHLISRWTTFPPGTPIAEGAPITPMGHPSPAGNPQGTPTAGSPDGTPIVPMGHPSSAPPWDTHHRRKIGTPIIASGAGTPPAGYHSGTFIGPEGQPIAWRPRHDLNEADFPAANARIVRLLRLPGTIAITPECASKREFLKLMRVCIQSGRELVQVRQHQLPPETYRNWFLAALELAAASPTRLLFNNPPEHFDPAWPGCGFHAPSRVLEEIAARPVSPGHLFSASCHSLAELHRAEALGADLALLSPVLPTAKYASAEPLGWHRFRRLADSVSLPVYALGGLSPEQTQHARNHGAFGVAGISQFV